MSKITKQNISCEGRIYKSRNINIIIVHARGRVDDFSFFDCLSTFRFSLIEFHSSFSISYKILTNYVYYYCILIMIV